MLSRIPRDVLHGVLETLDLEDTKSIQQFSFSAGGCINSGGKITTASGEFFLKWNDKNRFEHMFEAESKGLVLLFNRNAIRIPKVIGFGEKEHHQFLLLEFIDSKSKTRDYWDQLGVGLAALHSSSNDYFGLDYHNYIGSLRQFNRPYSRWVDFFIQQRLEVQVKLAIDDGKAGRSWLSKFEKLYEELPSLLPEEKPSLLHGDLWNGNLLTDENGAPCLIDPAVYFGNREADLGMTQLFGGFGDRFYSAYQERFPLIRGFRDRVDLYNLYPLLVHVNLFGGSYTRAVDSILDAFV
jgi:fructosamine-3-kinase